MSAARELMPGVSVTPRVVKTAVDRLGFGLSEGEGPVVLSSHGGIGGVDQARLTLDWLAPSHYRRLTHLPVEQVRCPTLIVHGTHDADVKFHHGVYAHEHIPGAERLWIEEGSHLGFWLSPHAAQAQATALEFLTVYGVD